MAKRWTPEEDVFLVQFFDVVGPEIGPHDLGRSVAATKARVQKLKESGAWEAYRAAEYHRLRALDLAGHVASEFEQDLVCDEMSHYAPTISATQ